MSNYDAALLADRFDEMVDVLTRLPPVVRKQKLSSWVDHVNDPNTAYGYNDFTVSRPKPTGKQIDRMDQALLWLISLKQEEQRIVWARGHRYSWRKIAMMMGCNKDTAKLRWQVVLLKLASRLNDE